MEERRIVGSCLSSAKAEAVMASQSPKPQLHTLNVYVGLTVNTCREGG